MIHLVVGLVLLTLGIMGIVTWWSTFGMVMRGVVPFALLLVGLLALLSGSRRVTRKKPELAEIVPMPSEKQESVGQ